MAAARPLSLTLAALLAALFVATLSPAAAAPRVRRQLVNENALQPLDDAADDEQTREKRKLEEATEAKYGIKNAVLGFVFGKINSLIDAKTRYVESLDRKNIELNKHYGIVAPSPGGLGSLGGAVSHAIGSKLQLIGPKLQAVTGLIGGLSSGKGGGSDSSGGSGLGSILSLVTSLSGSSSGGGGGATSGVETVDSSEEES